MPKNYMEDAEKYDFILSKSWIDQLGEKELVNIIKGIPDKKKVYEPGCGTGLLTEKLALIEGIDLITAVDPYGLFITKARERLAKYPHVNVVCTDALYHNLPEPADLAVMRYVNHHIPDKDKVNFLRKIADNVSVSGNILILDTFIPNYTSENGKYNSLKKFHGYRKSLVKGDDILEAIEDESLKLGLERNDEFKTSLKIFEEHADKAGLRVVSENVIRDPKITDPHLNGAYLIVCTNKH